MTGDTVRPESLRIDKWLWYARFARSRGKAVSLILEGAVRLNRRQVHKPSVTVTQGDLITLVIGGNVRAIEVLEPGSRRGPAAEAQRLYKDLRTESSADPAGDMADHQPAKPESGLHNDPIRSSRIARA